MDYPVGPVACKEDNPVKQPVVFAKDCRDEPFKEDGPERQALPLPNDTDHLDGPSSSKEDGPAPQFFCK